MSGAHTRSDRFFRWLYNSPWVDLALSVWLSCAYTWQQGWQRWIFFIVAIGSFVMAAEKGRQRFVKKSPPPNVVNVKITVDSDMSIEDVTEAIRRAMAGERNRSRQ